MNLYKKTKIVATIGPACGNKEVLKKMADEGMNVARLNFSHGDYPTHQEKIDILRELIADGYNLSIMLDTKGPEIRTGEFENDVAVFSKNDIVEIAMEPVLGTNKLFNVSHEGLFNDLGIGDLIKVDDGKLTFIIIDKNHAQHRLVCRALNNAKVKSRRNVVAPFARLSMPFISKRDKEDIIFGCQNQLDFIALSFTRRAQDVQDVRAILREQKCEDILLIAKIENQEGVNNIQEILEVVDGVMVARGDLGVELPPEEVPVVQKMLVSECRKRGKVVIVATQMLESMQTNPKPTRAEVSDVANAIFDGADAIMLSGETAVGEYPVEAVKMQSVISRRMEEILDYHKLAEERYIRINSTNDAIAYSVANTALLLQAKLIIAFSMSGGTSRRMSYYRPSCPIISVTSSPSVIRKLGLNWGVYAYHNPKTLKTLNEFEQKALEVATSFGLKAGETIILTGGDGAGNTNFMKIVTVV